MEGDNFALNELSMLAEVLDKVFSVLNIAGFIIGIFALVVGMFSVANIMFVSVKERTSIIGIKSVGCKRYIILMEFLIEAIILCIIGGLIGLTFSLYHPENYIHAHPICHDHVFDQYGHRCIFIYHCRNNIRDTTGIAGIRYGPGKAIRA